MKNKRSLETNQLFQHQSHLLSNKSNQKYLQINESIDYSPVFDFEVCVQIGDGRSQIIFMNQKSDPEQQAIQFCKKYNLEGEVVKLLTQSLQQQLAKQRNETKKIYQCNSKHMSQPIDQNDTQSQMLGAEKILSHSHKYYAWNKGSQQIWKQKQTPKGHPKINAVSEQIVNKAGKQSIIDFMSKKSSDRIQQHMIQKLQQEAKQLAHYSFHPMINPISEQVDKTLRITTKGSNTRFDQLYEYQKIYNHKQEQRRRNSIKQISFKPEINNLSKQIVKRKKSEASLFSGQKKRYSINQQRNNYQIESAQKIKRNNTNISNQKKQRKSKSKGKSTQFSYHLYEQAKRRQQKANKQQQKHKHNKQNWKIIGHSNQIITQLREQRIRSIFRSISKPPHQWLNIQDIQSKQLNSIEKIFMPIFNQMKELSTSLNQEEFIHAAFRLLIYLSPIQRAMLIRKSNTQNLDKQNPKKYMNTKSREIIKQKKYGQYSDIYLRGIMHQRQVREHIDKGKEEQVRKQLEDCTFKPRINGMPQNCGY